MVLSKRQLSVLAFTAIEVAGLGVWFYLMTANESVYNVDAVVGGAILAVALAIESITSGYGIGVRSTPLSYAVMVAVAETIIWTQWFILVSTGMWSAHGIGPGVVYLAALLTILHTTELNALLGRHPLELLYRSEAIGTAIVEAIGATLLWVAFTEGYLGAGLVILGVMLTVEHFSRAAALPMLADRLEIEYGTTGALND